MLSHRLIMREEFFGSVIYNTYDKDYYFFDQDSTEALYRIYAGEKDEELLEFYQELEENHLLSNTIQILHNKKNTTLSAPLKVFVDITYRCNLRCAHCFTDSHSMDQNELSTEQFFSLIDQMEEMGTMMLALAGGEPLLRPDFYEIVAYATQKGIKVGMTTNGLYITPECAKRLQELDISTISISLDGSEDHHDAIRGKNNWKKTVENIKIARKYCPKTKVGIRYTINSTNLHDYEEILRLGEELGLDVVKFNPIRPFGRACQHQNLLITQDQYISFLNSVQKVPTKMRYSLPKTPLDCCEYEFIDLGFGCTGGKETCNITPTGEFSGCAFLGPDFVVGNIKEIPLKQLWEKTQKSVHCEGNESCRECDSYSQCRAGCRNRALFAFGNIDAIDPHCTLKKTAPGQKLTIREENSQYLVFDFAKKRYKKYENFSQIKQEHPLLCKNQQYRFIKNPCQIPLKIFFDITSGCNSRCIHCYNNSSTSLHDELTTGEIRQLARQAEALGIHQISIAGGEPFLRKDICEILSIFRESNIQVSITTNGLLLTEKILQKFSPDLIDHLTISIDGFTKEQYQRIRGVDGFELLNANINRLHEIFSGETSMRVSLMKGNTEPEKIIEYALKHRFKTVKINKTHLLGRFLSHSEYALSDEEYEYALDRFEELQKSSSIHIELPREKYLNHHAALPCSAGKKTISISPRGEVFPCAFGPESFSFGSLREKSLLDILVENQQFTVHNPFCLACPGMKKTRGIPQKAILT